MKDHEIRELINNLVKVSIEFHNHGQLRARIQDAMSGVISTLKETQPDGYVVLGKSLNDVSFVTSKPEGISAPVWFKPQSPNSCQGIPMEDCNYLTKCGTVCNKCGRLHRFIFSFKSDSSNKNKLP